MESQVQGVDVLLLTSGLPGVEKIDVPVPTLLFMGLKCKEGGRSESDLDK